MGNRKYGKRKWEEFRVEYGMDDISQWLEFFALLKNLEKRFILNVYICRFTNS